MLILVVLNHDIERLAVCFVSWVVEKPTGCFLFDIREHHLLMYYYELKCSLNIYHMNSSPDIQFSVFRYSVFCGLGLQPLELTLRKDNLHPQNIASFSFRVVNISFVKWQAGNLQGLLPDSLASHRHTLFVAAQKGNSRVFFFFSSKHFR